MMSEDMVTPKKSIFDPIRRWWWSRQFQKARKALTVMVEKKDPEIYQQIRACAEIMAKDMCMRWLDNQRINHCAKCPNSKPLITVNGVYLCPGHARKAGENGSLNVPLTVVRS